MITYKLNQAEIKVKTRKSNEVEIKEPSKCQISLNPTIQAENMNDEELMTLFFCQKNRGAFATIVSAKRKAEMVKKRIKGLLRL